MLDAASQAIDRARAGRGPTLIEAVTYRRYGHGASDNRSYRTREEEAEWEAKCPIKHYTALLVERGIVTEARDQRVDGRGGRGSAGGDPLRHGSRAARSEDSDRLRF